MLLAATAFWSQSSGVQILVDTGPAVLIKIKSPCNISYQVSTTIEIDILSRKAFDKK